MSKFLIERISWIVFFFMIQMLLLFIAFLDPSISVQTTLYYIFLFFMLFMLFIVIRYNKESDYYKSVEEWQPGDDVKIIKEARSPYEKITEQKILAQRDYYKEELGEYLVDLEQEKDDLLAWTHEVKTPLTTMKLMIERVENEQLNRQLMSEWLSIYLLLDQQLHQKRIPMMEKDLHIEKVPLEPIIFQEIKDLRAWCMEKGIGFDIQLEQKEVLTDAKWLGFIVRQLVTNAVKYSMDSVIEIKCLKNEEHVQLVIQDYGKGISQRDLPRIFDRGFTSTTNHKEQAATGMGLYLTKKAADVLKIKIDVETKIDMGTTFTLTFATENDFLSITGM